jgi:hypothetical protein
MRYRYTAYALQGFSKTKGDPDSLNFWEFSEFIENKVWREQLFSLWPVGTPDLYMDLVYLKDSGLLKIENNERVKIRKNLLNETVAEALDEDFKKVTVKITDRAQLAKVASGIRHSVEPTAKFFSNEYIKRINSALIALEKEAL